MKLLVLMKTIPTPHLVFFAFPQIQFVSPTNKHLWEEVQKSVPLRTASRIFFFQQFTYFLKNSVL